MLGTVRKGAWRLGRKVYCWARGDMANSPDRNGEYWLLDQLLRGAADSRVLLDVGANRGDWSLHALARAANLKTPFQLIAFEPSAATRQILEKNLAGHAGAEVSAFALSSSEGEADFFSNTVGSGTNSLSPASGPTLEKVQMLTVDAFLLSRYIDRVAMIKVDTEGFDFEVLKGARESLSAGRIELVQFEYNWRWLLNRASLLDVFRFIERMPYRLGKLVGGSLIIYDEWHFEMDRYFENNYVLIRSDSRLMSLGTQVTFDASNCVVPVAGR